MTCNEKQDFVQDINSSHGQASAFISVPEACHIFFPKRQGGGAPGGKKCPSPTITVVSAPLPHL